MGPITLKARVAAPGGMFYVFALLVQPKTKSISEVAAVAGESAEFLSADLNGSFREFVAWQKSEVFAGRADERATLDIQRFVGTRFKNMEWAERVTQRLLEGDLDALQYDLSLELEVALGQKNLVFQFAVREEGADSPSPSDAPAPSAGGPAEPDEDLSGMLPLAFVISPFMGMPVSRLQLGERIRVRFKDLKAPRTASYVEMQGLNQQPGAPEITATVRSIGSVKKSGEMLVKLDLPGGQKGFIKEENLNLKVRTAAEVKGRGGQSALADRGLIGAPLLIMLAALGVILLGGVLLFVLF